MVVGAVLDDAGLPICSEMWPGNAADVKSLLPVADRLRARFGITDMCVVADRGMISAETIDGLERRGMRFILGARMRKQKEVRDDVLDAGGEWIEVHPAKRKKKDLSPLKVKEVIVNGHRYIVCHNEDQARKDAHDRAAILDALTASLKHGDKSLVGNKGYRKFLKSKSGGFEIDFEKAEFEARYDGKWVLRTNTEFDAAQVALKYKQLWTVEHLFRSIKSLLDTRPVFHKCDETIIGHVFCSFLALVLMKELESRILGRGWNLEWSDVIRDLDKFEEVEIKHSDKRFLLRSELKGVSGKVFQAAGVAIPQTVTKLGDEGE